MSQSIVMTPYKRQNGDTTIKIERVDAIDHSRLYYESKAQSSSLVVNHLGDLSDSCLLEEPQMQLEFICIVANEKSYDSYAENRILKYWFNDDVDNLRRLDCSYDFFKDIINPSTFPKDYTGFVKKMMKQMQQGKYANLRRVDVELIKLDKGQQEALVPETSEKSTVEKAKEFIHAKLDEAFPNYMTMEDISRLMKVDENVIQMHLDDLIAQDIVKKIQLDGKFIGRAGYRRNYPGMANEKVEEVISNNHYQQVASSEKPTIAIITNLLCEKLAVDAMMTDRTTFVRYKTEGESHMYSIGNIGSHKVISTKLSMVGRVLQAKISSGNTTTRLLGAFQDIKHVFIVGVGGGVPHVNEFDKHSRLGDIVVSAPITMETDESRNQDHMYLFCDKVVYPSEDAPADTPVKFLLKYYKPDDQQLQRCVESVLDDHENDPSQCPWMQHMEHVWESSDKEGMDFSRPPPETDKLKIRMGGGVTFDMKHPDVPQELSHLYVTGTPAVRLGCLGSGQQICENDHLRDNFAQEQHLLAWDAEYDQVLESIMGNRLGSYLFIRGISDYGDGTKDPSWQPYAALSAAGFMKAVILKIPRD